MSKFTFDFKFDDTFSLMLQSVEAKVEEVAQNFTPFSFVKGDWREIDLKADKADLPFIVFLVPDQGTLTMNRGLYFDSVRCLVGFFDKVNRDAYAEDNMAVYQAMRAVGLKFIDALNASGYFEPITETRYYVYTEMLSSNVTGVVFELTLKQSQGVCV